MRQLATSIRKVTLILGIFAGLAGCQDQGITNTQPASVPASEAAVPSPASTLDGLIDEDTGEVVTKLPVPTWDNASRTSAVDAAVKFMTAFARPDLDFSTWWSGIEPLMDPSSHQTYVHIDPINIPARRVTDAGKIVDESSSYIARVEVPTDAGVYTLVLVREKQDPWLVAQIIAPEREIHR